MRGQGGGSGTAVSIHLHHTLQGLQSPLLARRRGGRRIGLRRLGGLRRAPRALPGPSGAGAAAAAAAPGARALPGRGAGSLPRGLRLAPLGRGRWGRLSARRGWGIGAPLRGGPPCSRGGTLSRCRRCIRRGVAARTTCRLDDLAADVQRDVGPDVRPHDVDGTRALPTELGGCEGEEEGGWEPTPPTSPTYVQQGRLQAV